MTLAILTLATGTLVTGPQPFVQAEEAKPDEVLEVKIGLVALARKKRFTLSRIDYPAKDDGIAGAEVGIGDNNTTGRFLKQKYTLKTMRVRKAEKAHEKVAALIEDGVKFILIDLPADTIAKITDQFKDSEVVFFNISARENKLRQEGCKPNLLHIAPSRAMLADALIQYLVKQKWQRIFLIRGAFPADKEYAASIQRSAKRFGAKIVEEREFKEKPGAARTDGGHALIQKQMLTFTQKARTHDVVVVADESEVFGHYLPFRTWTPRPITGTAGLTPMTFHSAHEQWGASQMQNRFYRKARRSIKPVDYNAFVAVRLVGEAVTRTKSAEFSKWSAYLKGPDIAIPGFKGQKLSFRPWNYQLRQPIMLTNRHLAVSWSPQEGFLHQTSYLDTLGFDKPESKCKLN